MKQKEQAEQSRQWIMEALLLLMDKKPFESITITDITKKAGVARLTFYRHYENKEQIIEDYYSETFNKFLMEISQTKKITKKDALRRCFEYWRQEEKVVKSLVEHNMKHLLYDKLDGYLGCIQVLKTSPYNNLQMKFVNGGLLTALIDWVLDSQGYSAGEMAEMIQGLISEGKNE